MVVVGMAASSQARLAGLAFYRAASRSAEQNRAFAHERRLAKQILGLNADRGSIPDIAASLSRFAA